VACTPDQHSNVALSGSHTTQNTRTLSLPYHVLASMPRSSCGGHVQVAVFVKRPWDDTAASASGQARVGVHKGGDQEVGVGRVGKAHMTGGKKDSHI